MWPASDIWEQTLPFEKLTEIVSSLARFIFDQAAWV